MMRGFCRTRAATRLGSTICDEVVTGALILRLAAMPVTQSLGRRAILTGHFCLRANSLQEITTDASAEEAMSWRWRRVQIG